MLGTAAAVQIGCSNASRMAVSGRGAADDGEARLPRHSARSEGMGKIERKSGMKLHPRVQVIREIKR